MEGTNINIGGPITDSTDKTYLGNGCPNWDTSKPDNGGSKVSCATDKVNTYDGETQKIGAYYTFQAATSGSGSAVTAEGTNAPDSFCPLGWQLPYGGTGGDYYDMSRSYDNLLRKIYSIPISVTVARQHRKYPLSNIQSGMMDANGAGALLFMQDLSGRQWSSTIGVSGYSQAYFFEIHENSYNIRVNSKPHGHAIRCDNNFNIFSSTARWRVYQRI